VLGVTGLGKVATIYISDDCLEVWERFIEIAKREKNNISKVILELAKDYVEKHSSNPVTPLDKWVSQPEFTLFPTLGEPPDYRKLREFPRSKLAELRDNAQAYYSLSEDLLRWLSIHEKDHIPLGLREKYCPFCEG
jgi:hypothetical protein